MRVVSLFDGISGGRETLSRLGIPVEKYYAYEIDKYAIQAAMKNYPDIIQLGSVIDADFKSLLADGPIDMIIGGSPCQDLSAAKDNGQGLNGEKSKLFFEYVRAIQEIQPKYFFLENVASMKPIWKDKMSEIMGVEPVMINSSVVCAAERKRLYWTNIPKPDFELEDKGIMLRDICVPANEVPAKYWYDRPFEYNGDDAKIQCTIAIGGRRSIQEVYNLNNKANTILCDGNGGNLMKKVYQDGRCRKLMPIEYERLQTLPDNYTEGLSDSRRYTAIGNGWTIDVIAYLFDKLKEVGNG